MAIRWLHEAWKEEINLTIKNCFEKCGIKGDNELMKVEDDDDLEFEALVKEFTLDISAAEYKCGIPTKMFQRLSQGSMNSGSIGDSRSEKTALMQFRIQKLQVIRSKRFPMMTEAMTSENDKLEQESMGFKEIITMLDKRKRCFVFDDESQYMLSAISKTIAERQLKNRK